MIWIIILTISFSILIFAVLLIAPFTVPQNWEYQVSLFGKFWKLCTAGLHWRLRWFTNIDAQVFMGDQSIQLPLGRLETGGGLVNFKDQSASMDVTFYFKVVDSIKATYETTNVLKMIEDLADDAIRSFIALFEIEEVNILNTRADLGWIATTLKPENDPSVKSPAHDKSNFYLTLSSWGIKPLYFVVGDTDLPEDIIEQIKRRQKANTDIDVAFLEIESSRNKMKKVIIEAQADKKVEILRATGVAEGMDEISKSMAYRIQELMTRNGMSEEAARSYVVALAKMKALEKSGQVIWAEGNSIAGQGASFGAGFNSTNADSPAKPN